MSTGPPTPAALSERDLSYLKLLKTLKTAGAGESSLGVVRRIAAWIDSLPVLNLVCVTQGWYDDWEVKEALLHNELTPQRFRTDLERAVAIFDLLREMDDATLSAEEKAEIQESVRHLFKTLPEHDRGVVKQHAYSLSASRRGPPPATPAASVQEKAEAVPAPQGAGFDPLLASELGFDVPTMDLPADGSVTEVIRATEQQAVAREAEAALLEPPPEAAPAAPQDVDPLLAAEFGFDLPVEPTPPPPQPTRVAEPAPQPAMPVLAGALAAAGDAQKLALAGSTADANVLAALVHETREDVQLALVANPHLTDRHAAILARHAGHRAAEALYRNRRLFMRPLVQHALLECANAPAVAHLEIVGTLPLPELVTVLGSPKIRALEVKAKARARLLMMFKSLGTAEKLATIRKGGRRILKELWTDFFRDEALVIKCLQERQLDESSVVEIARSRVAPRRALELMGNDPGWSSNPQVRMELVQNPKTPRQVVTKLIQKMSPAERKLVKSNAALPDAVRRFA